MKNIYLIIKKKVDVCPKPSEKSVYTESLNSDLKMMDSEQRRQIQLVSLAVDA